VINLKHLNKWFICNYSLFKLSTRFVLSLQAFYRANACQCFKRNVGFVFRLF
jgi:hypothetical protein